MKDLVSIIVTSYNHAEYLKQRINSLLCQTYSNAEIIVVDDCSTDGSRDVLNEYRNQENVAIVVLEQNKGYATASNLGVSMAKGEYVMFAECDDFSEPSQVEVLYNALHSNNSAVVAYCRSNMVDGKGILHGDDFKFRETLFKKMCSTDRLIPQKLILRFLMFSCVVPNMSAAMFRKSSFYAIGGVSPAFRACADWDFWCRMAATGDFYYVSKPLNNFRSHSTTVRSTFKISLQLCEIFRIVYSVYAKTHLSFGERLKFRFNTGFIWASFSVEQPKNWVMGFPKVWIESLKYDKAGVFFLLAGFLLRFVVFLQNRLSIK